MVWELDIREGNIIPKFQIKIELMNQKIKYIVIEL